MGLIACRYIVLPRWQDVAKEARSIMGGLGKLHFGEGTTVRMAVHFVRVRAKSLYAASCPVVAKSLYAASVHGTNGDFSDYLNGTLQAVLWLHTAV